MPTTNDSMASIFENEVSTSQKNEEVTKESNEPSYDLRKFKLERILQNNTVRKSIALLGKFPDLSQTDQAIVLFEKKAFRESEVQTEDKQAENVDTKTEEDSMQNGSSYFENDLQIQTEFINNIYGSFQCVPSAKLNGKFRFQSINKLDINLKIYL